MCGRFVSGNSPDRIAAYFGASFDTPLTEIPEPNYNVAPTADVYGVVAGPAAQPTLRTYRWGLVPSWAKDIKVGVKMINARAETIATKSAFKPLLRAKRLIIPMDGFYEWQVVAGQKAKQPMYIHRRDDEPLAVAGLWAAWRDPASSDEERKWLHSCTVITTAANATMAPVHDRMPALLPASRWDAWLDPDNHDIDALLGLLVPAPDDLLVIRPVSTAVNSVRSNGPELIAPATVA
jgi:putative SOS response-associated peptidase YedK